MFNQFANEFIGYRAVEVNLVPVFFVPMISSLDGGVRPSQFDSTFRVTFEHHHIGLVKQQATKDFPMHAKRHERIIKRLSLIHI